jgi:ribonuclease HII
MQKAHELYPVYGFNRHQGYPTKAHREALQLHGPCELHRRTFRGVAELVEKEPVSPPDQKGLW